MGGILKKWWFWAAIFVVGLILQKCDSGGGMSYKEWFFSDSTNFTTWKNGSVGYARTYLNELDLKKDSTFKLNFMVEGYGPVELAGKYSVAGMYNIADADYLLKKELELDKNEYLKLDIKWDGDVSSFDVLGNPYVGLPYRLEKPGSCGNRQYHGCRDYFLVGEDTEGKKVTSIGVVYTSCQEGTGKRFNYIKWLVR